MILLSISMASRTQFLTVPLQALCTRITVQKYAGRSFQRPEKVFRSSNKSFAVDQSTKCANKTAMMSFWHANTRRRVRLPWIIHRMRWIYKPKHPIAFCRRGSGPVCTSKKVCVRGSGRYVRREAPMYGLREERVQIRSQGLGCSGMRQLGRLRLAPVSPHDATPLGGRLSSLRLMLFQLDWPTVSARATAPSQLGDYSPHRRLGLHGVIGQTFGAFRRYPQGKTLHWRDRRAITPLFTDKLTE